MASKTVLITLALTLLAGSNATINSLIPIGKELTYNYHALMKAGTNFPLQYASSFVLDGLLSMYSHQNSTFLYFASLQYKMHNGEYDEWNEFDTKMIPLPKELEDLYKTFKIIYDDDGTITGITTSADEKQFIVNIKKSIVAIMQMDWKQVNIESKNHHAFHTEEMTLYGKGKAYYNVMPAKMTIEKMHEPHSSHHLYSHMITNKHATKTCKARFDEPLTHDDMKSYKLSKRDDNFIIETIDANGGIYYHPYKGKSDAHHIWTNTYMSLLAIQDMTPKEIEGEKVHKGLTYYITDYETIDGTFPDISNGRRTWDMDKLMEIVETLMADMFEYIGSDNLKTELPEEKHTQLINRIKRHMLYMDIEHLEKLYTKLAAKTGEKSKLYIEVYHDMLPLIGTHASMNHIRTLIMNKKIKDDTAINMLKAMPFHVQFPNKNLIEEMSALLHLEDKIDQSVRNAAILSFSNLIQQAIERHNQLKQRNTWHGFDQEDDYVAETDTEKMMFPDEKYYEKYVTEFVIKLKAAENDDTKFVYMYAIGNTKMASIVQHLMPFAKGEVWEDKFLTTMAAMAMSPVILHDEDMAYEIYWPIMSCSKMPTANRAMAYYMLMSSQPSVQRLNNIYFHMLNEENHALYQFHYSYMKAMIKTTDPCKETFRTHLNQIMRYTLAPQFHGMTGYYQIDYTDKYGFGEAMQWMIVNTQHESDQIIKFTMQSHQDNMLYTPYNVLIRFSGISQTLADNLKLDIGKLDITYSWNIVERIFYSIMANKEMKVNIMVMNYEQMVMVYNIDTSYLAEKFATIIDSDDEDEDEDEDISKFMSIEYPSATTIIMPTQMGFPAFYQEYMPTLYYFDMDISRSNDTSKPVNMDFYYKSMSHGRKGLSFYNPIVDMWQGISKMYTMDTAFSFNIDFSTDSKNENYTFVLKQRNNSIKDIVGVRSHVQSVVFTLDDMKHNYLKESCPECSSVQSTTIGNEYKHKSELYDRYIDFLGYHCLITTFDSERYFDKITLSQFYHMLSEHSVKNYETVIGDWLLHDMSVMQYIQNQPFPASNGFLFRFEPMKYNPMASIELKFRGTEDIKRNGRLTPASKIKANLALTFKLYEEEFSTFETNFTLDSNLGDTSHIMKIDTDVTLHPQEKGRFCIDGWMKWKDDKMNAQLNLAIAEVISKGSCKDFLEVKLLAEKTPEQIDGKHMYKECFNYLWSSIKEEQTMECYAAHSTLRKYTYDIKSTSDNMKINFFWPIDKFIKGYYKPNYEVAHTLRTDMANNTYRFEVDYPMLEHVANVHVFSTESEYKISSIPMENWGLSFLHPYNTQYSETMQMYRDLGIVMKKCYIETTTLNNVMDFNVNFTMPDDWSLYFGDVHTVAEGSDAEHSMWAKKIDDKMALKFKHDTHTLEIIPIGKKRFDITVDGKKLDMMTTTSHTENWFHFDYIKKTGVIAMLVHQHCYDTKYITYDGAEAYLEFPLANVKYDGHCFDQVNQKEVDEEEEE